MGLAKGVPSYIGGIGFYSCRYGIAFGVAACAF